MRYRSECLKNDIKGNWDYFIDLGGRFTGKSYAWKNYIIDEIVKSDYTKKLLYVRRNEKDIKATNVTNYFADCRVYELTAGKYSMIQAYGNKLYLANLNDKGKVIREVLIGFFYSLTDATSVKSTLRDLGIAYMLYEEFIPENGKYLYDEPNILQSLVGTVYGNNEKKVVLIGNTLSRVNPYYISWGLKEARKLKPNESVDILSDDNTVVRVCNVLPNEGRDAKGYLGGKGKQIVNGIFETEIFPPCPVGSTYIRSIFLQTQGFTFELELRSLKGDMFVFVHPCTNPRALTRARLILSDEFSISRRVRPYLEHDGKHEQLYGDLLNQGKICFSDNLTATDFFHCIANYPYLRATKLVFNELNNFSNIAQKI